MPFEEGERTVPLRRLSTTSIDKFDSIVPNLELEWHVRKYQKNFFCYGKELNAKCPHKKILAKHTVHTFSSEEKKNQRNCIDLFFGMCLCSCVLCVIVQFYFLKIHYWIGEKAKADRMAVMAMMAVKK